MLNHIIIPKEQVITIPESMNCLDALQILEDNNLRNAPIVDESMSLFRGNIYRYHLYKHAYQHPGDDLSKLPVTHFLKNATRVVHVNDSIIQLMFEIKDLPYIAVLNENNAFAGIINHDDFRDYLAQAWNLAEIGYIIRIPYKGIKGEHYKLSRFVARYVQPDGIIYLGEAKGRSAAVTLTLSRKLDIVQVNSLMYDLKRKKYLPEMINFK